MKKQAEQDRLVIKGFMKKKASLLVAHQEKS
jgi:hypothetical protein